MNLNITLSKVSGTRLAHGPLSVGPGGPATGPVVRPVVGRTRGGSVTTSDRERHFIPGKIFQLRHIEIEI